MDPSLPSVKSILAVLSRQVADGDAKTVATRRRGNSRHPVNALDSEAPKVWAGWVEDTWKDQTAAGYAIDLGCDMGGFARALATARPELRVVGLEVRRQAGSPWAVVQSKSGLLLGWGNSHFCRGCTACTELLLNGFVWGHCPQILRKIKDIKSNEPIDIPFHPLLVEGKPHLAMC